MNQPQLGTYEYIALSLIRPSTTNPRRNFDQVALEELAASIREVGVTQPILVRPWPKHVPLDPPSATVSFEVVAGARRYRAAQMAGLDAIPAFFRKLTDAEASELQLIENLQRADLHPVEEAEGYRALIAGGSTVEDCAKKSGKTRAHVQKILKLLSLDLPAKTLFHAGHLNLGHAMHLAMLTQADQVRAVRKLLGAEHQPKSLDLVKHTESEIASHDKYHKGRRMISETESQLKDWISSNIFTSLDKVPWSLDDAALVPEAGACTTCPKRTGSNVALFADLTAKEDVCLDSACFATKHKAYQAVTISAAAESGKPMLRLSAKPGAKKIELDRVEKKILLKGQWMKAAKASCAEARKGIMTDDSGSYDSEKLKAGQTLFVCANQGCPVHKHTVEQPVEAGSTSSGRAVAESWEVKEEKRKTFAARELPVREAVYRAIRPNVAVKVNLEEMYSTLVRGYIIQSIQNPSFKTICALWGWGETASVVDAEEDDEDYFDDDDDEEIEQSAAYADESDIGRWVSPHTRIVARKLRELEYTELTLLLFDIGNVSVLSLGHDAYKSPEADRKPLWDMAKNFGVDADAIEEQVQKNNPKLWPELQLKPEVPEKPAKKKLSAADQAKRKKAASKSFPAKKAEISGELKKRIVSNFKKRMAAVKGKGVDRKSAGSGEKAGVA